MWIPQLSSAVRPLYLAIVEALAEDVALGHLDADQRLPTHRELSRRLGVSVGTVTRAYREAGRRGLVRGEVGRGMFVNSGWTRKVVLEAPATSYPPVIDLGVSWPVYGEDPDLRPALTKIAAWSGLASLTRYQPHGGMERHRRAGARWLAGLGYTVSDDNVLVTAGTHNALVVTLSALMEPGETLLTEALTYPGVKAAAGLLRLKLEGVAIDEEGLIPDALAEAARRGRGRLLYCVPCIHNPTTATLSEERRRAIADIAREYDLQIIEDAVHYPLQTERLTAIAEIAPERTFMIAGFAKAVCGGLRIAFMAAPSEHVEEISQRIWAAMWMAPPLNAEIASRWIEDGTAEKTVERKKLEADARLELVEKMLPAGSYRSAPHTFHIWLSTPDGWGSADFSAAAFRRGVVVAPSEVFAVEGEPPPAAVRVCTSAAEDRRALERALKVLAHLLSSEPRAAGSSL